MARRSRRGGIPEWLTQTRLPIFIVDSRRVVLFFNRGSELLTGWNAADLVGKVCEWHSSGQPEEPGTLLAALCPPGEIRSQTHRTHLLTREGSSLDRVVRFFPLAATDETEEPVRWLGVIELPESAHDASVSYESELHAELSYLKSDLRRRFAFDDLIATSSTMRQILRRLQLAITSFASIAFHGAAGTGKEHLARAVHYAGDTRVRAFVPVDCRRPRPELTEILDRLIAPEREAPPIPALRRGAVLLQYVDHLPSDWQQRLVDEVTLDSGPEAVRWMIASEVPFATLLDRERMLPEFWNRFGVIEVSLPSLRDRADEFRVLAQHALERCNLGDKQILGFSPEVWEQFQDYHWPGNLHELFEVIREAHQTATGSMITTTDLPFRFRAGQDAQSVGPVPSLPLVPLEERLMQVEREQLLLALDRSHGNKQLAAELLGIPRPKLYRRLEAHGLLEASQERSAPEGPQEPDE